MELTGAEIVIRCLQEEGVEYVFGYPGGAVLYLYDELFKQNAVKHILVRHEQGAVHAADGYARSTEKVGVALVTSGPGVTNAVTDEGCEVFNRLSTARRERLTELSAQWPPEQRAQIAKVLRGLARALVPDTPATRG